jgi:hypothetical protein
VTNKLAEALAKRDDDVLFDDESPSLGEYIEWWLTTSKRGRVKATTYESYAREVRKHIIPGLGRIRLKSFSPAHLQSFYSSNCDSGLAPRTVHYHHTLLNQALKMALKWADIDLRERTLSVNRTLSAAKGGPVFGPPKTSRSRRKIFLCLKSVEALRRHRERQVTEKEALGERWHDDDLVHDQETFWSMDRGAL